MRYLNDITIFLVAIIIAGGAYAESAINLAAGLHAATIRQPRRCI
jgi:hypothetical protein